MTVNVAGYRGKRVLEEGGPVSVYLADHEGHEVALYVADSSVGLDRGSFLDRVESLKQLPAGLPIARTLEGGASASAFWLAAEHHPGPTWADLFRGGKACPGALAMAELALQLTAPLEAAYQVGLHHGGLGPQSVVMTPEGGLMITNFGLTSLFRAPVILDMRYRAPEHICTTMALDARTDVYGIGVILYQLLTIRPPYLDRAPALLDNCILSEPLSMTGKKIPPGLQEIVGRATAKDPMKRYSSVAVLRAALLEISGQLAIVTLGEAGVLPASGVRHQSAEEAAAETLRSGELAAADATPGSGGAEPSTLKVPSPPAEGPPTPASSLVDVNPVEVALPEPRTPPAGLAGATRADGRSARRAALRFGRFAPHRRPPRGIGRIVWAAAGLGALCIGAVLLITVRPPVVVVEGSGPAAVMAAPPPPPVVVAPVLLPEPDRPQPAAPAPEARSTVAAHQPPPSAPSATAPPPAAAAPPDKMHSGKAKRFSWENSDPCALSWYRCPK